MPSSFLPISTLPEIAKCIDGAERILKADIARMKKLLADRAACPPQLPKSLFRKQKSPSTGLAEAESIREAVVVDTSRAIQNAIDELLSSGFHRAELSLLAREADVVSKLGHKYRKASELGDDPSVPRAAYVSTEAIGDSQGAVTGTLVYVRAGLLMGPVAGRTLAAIAAAAALGGGAGEAS
jgi:hypothetical protein